MNFVTFIDEVARKGITPLVAVSAREFKQGERVRLYGSEYAVMADGPGRTVTHVSVDGRGIPGAMVRVVRVVPAERYRCTASTVTFSWPPEDVLRGKSAVDERLGSGVVLG